MGWGNASPNPLGPAYEFYSTDERFHAEAGGEFLQGNDDERDRDEKEEEGDDGKEEETRFRFGASASGGNKEETSEEEEEEEDMSTDSELVMSMSDVLARHIISDGAPGESPFPSPGEVDAPTPVTVELLEALVRPAACPNCRATISLDTYRRLVAPQAYESRLRLLLLTHSHMFVNFDETLQLALPSTLMSPAYLRVLASACLQRAQILEDLQLSVPV